MKGLFSAVETITFVLLLVWLGRLVSSQLFIELELIQMNLIQKAQTCNANKTLLFENQLLIYVTK